ncbi:hypothetical protein BJX70DRAFT_403326 [Aspergillus crustosus]
MDYERCAALHNEILLRGYLGRGMRWPSPPPKTWWEKEAPSPEIASKLSPSLIEFLKRAHLPSNASAPHSIFYYLSYVPSPEEMISNLFLRKFNGSSEGGPYVLLYQYNAIHEEEGLGLMPLETILAGYIDMIDEGKVAAVANWEDGEPGVPEWPWPAPPWVLHIYTAVDVQKAVAATKRLLDAIEAKIEEHEHEHEHSAGPSETKAADTNYLPWNDPAALPADLVPPGTFAFEFLQGIKMLKARFRYIAPGVRFPTVEEFLAQKAETPPWQEPGQHPLRLMHVEQPEDDDREDNNNREDDGEDDGEDSNGDNLEKEQQTEETETEPEQPKINSPKYPGLYIEQVTPSASFHFSNESRLELPFGIGANGWARQSSGQPLGYNIAEWRPAPADTAWDLYQSGDPTGFTDIRLVQIHKVLENWAGMVEGGHWGVDGEGVVGGSGRFREADTEEGWGLYWIPVSW